ncbi:hypothetical protein E1281_37690 [Actinomadura sp. KC345]|uniref:hypothetical protein n=1 Tax=Actinomadura sp. KC345 TaxID=2530371 RepID=UPI00104E80E0|nr:hypothetical protein [Actinomadura sp. KC345]TDC41111.1 hypothetical protein E1281_37690 [Actinomadura sp. KC345]
MALKIQVLKCGTCGKPRGLTHTCVTRMDRKRKPGKTRLKPRVKVTATCRTCGKPRGLNHTCQISTDFKKRKAAAARRQAAERKRRQAARRKAAAAARRQNTPSKPRTPAAKPVPGKAGAGKAGHDYRTCKDTECRRYACQAWKEAYAEAMAIGLEDGYQQSYEQGRRESQQASPATGTPHMDERQIKAQVAEHFPDDNVREDEIVLKPNGDIVIDRRKTAAWAKPLVVGRWKN